MSTADVRVQALEVLYAADAISESVPDTSGIRARSRRLVEGVWEHRAELDEAIGEVASGWRVERMPTIDRNLLRLALYELRHTETPVGVVISEAVELAKGYSTARSGRFINGVLAELARLERPSDEVESLAGDLDSQTGDQAAELPALEG